MQRYGVTGTGTPRWYCPVCAVTAVRRRPDARTTRYARSLTRWICGTKTLEDIANDCRVNRRTLTRRFVRFLETPPFPPAHLPYDAVLILDAIWIGGRAAVAFIARTPASVRSWGFAGSESHESWSMFVCSLTQPRAVVVDGNGGLLWAIQHCWDGVLLQRCLAHVMRVALGKLTQRPRTEADRSLRRLVLLLPRIRTRRQKRRWIRMFWKWQRRSDDFLRERTYYEAQGRRRWWYTHRTLRAVRSHLRNALPHLFTYVRHPWIPRTSNHLEGGTNARLEELIGRHRGMPLEHRKALVAHFLHSKTEKKPTRNVS